MFIKLIKECAKFSCVLVVAFIVLELYYQINFRFALALPKFVRVYNHSYFDSEGTPRFPENVDAWHRSYHGKEDILVNINSHGFRGQEPDQNRSYRIVMIGDSTLFNGGVEIDKTYPFIIEKQIQEKLNQPKIEVLNFGVGDINAYQYLQKLKNHAIAYQPDLVVVFLYLNDSQDSMSTDFLFSPRISERTWYHSFAYEKLYYLFRNFYILFRVQKSGRFDWVHSFQSKSYLNDTLEWKKILHQARFDWGAAWIPEKWISIETSLIEMNKVVKANNSKMWLVIMPVKPQVLMKDSTENLFFPQKTARDIAIKHGIEYIDPLPYFRMQEKSENLYYDQCHFTVAGNKSMAEFLTPMLEKWIIVKENS